MNPDDPFLLVERELGLLMRRSHGASAVLARAVHPALEPGAYPLLSKIACQPGIRASELARYVNVSKGTMSRQLRRIEELGLVTRRPDPHDSRGQLLELTPDGARQVAAAQEARRRWFRDALASWDPSEVATFADQLRRLNADVERAVRTRQEP
ncbi:MarR family winged helix-turn-helix transcriptional regulator [Cellulomonas sp. P24]|uniref:MarR family winged helix-turn-helix transcriptional regulator n=1 Tax=Cellulomonas sp. P24 TaxID=2885206 RepID=UPI00216B30E1|nr:MarR family transcriptional regulator [Cellulomonas sp. P24]MCR6493248.1 MarR family transcriptional regulator [Cellulomonas sp. P24]